MCPNGSTKQAYISWKEATSTTAVSEAIINTEVIDEKKEKIRDDYRHTKCVYTNRNHIGQR